MAPSKCPQGHPYDRWNTRRTGYGSPVCRACDRERQRLRREGLEGTKRSVSPCVECRAPVLQTPGPGRVKRYCDDCKRLVDGRLRREYRQRQREARG